MEKEKAQAETKTHELKLLKNGMHFSRLQAIIFASLFAVVGGLVYILVFAASTYNVKINFQNSGSAIPSNYLPDYGYTYGDRGNGYTYGWSTNNSGNMRDRNATNSPDQRYDTFGYMQYYNTASASWDISLPNGTYKVRLVAGDATKFDSVFKINVENTLAINGTPTATNHWLDNTVTVNVSDGKLTISNATGSVNNKLNFIEITEVATNVAKGVITAPTIDGNLTEADWSLSNSLAKTVIGSNNNTATAGVLWDNSYLYVAAKVMDASLKADSANAWEDDSVEVYIDANHNKGTAYDSYDRQFNQGWNRNALTEIGGKTTGVKSAYASITGGYTVEMAIPWSNLGVTPSAGMAIGFDVGVNDDDNGGGRDAQAVWNGTVNDYRDTSAFGDITLGNIVVPQTTISFSASPSSVTAGQSSTLTWSASNATSCTAGGGWTGTKSVSGSVSTGTLQSSTAYNLTCTGLSGAQSSASVSVNVSVAPTPPPPTGSNVLFEDLFDGTANAAPDSTKWVMHAENCDPPNDYACIKKSNSYLDGSGHLVLRAKRESANYLSGGVYSSAWISTFNYGSGWPASGVKAAFAPPYHVEASVLMGSAPGLWGGPWSINVDRPASQNIYELDWAEERSTYMTTADCHQHTWLGGKDTAPWDCGGKTVSDMSKNWHTFAADVYADKVIYYIDGAVSRTAYGVSGKQGILLNFTVAPPGSWGSGGKQPDASDPGPWDMKIDYVRVTSL